MARTVVLVVLCAMLELCGPLGGAEAAPGPHDDAYILGYAEAVLAERFGLAAPSLAVGGGLVSVSARDLVGADQARVEAALRAIRGVRGVELRPAVESSAAPATPAVASPAAPADAPSAAPPAAAASAAPLAPVADAEPSPATGFLPGGLLFRPLLADPRWPHFSAAFQYYLRDPDFTEIVAVSLGESFAIYRGALGVDLWEVGVQAGVFSIFDLASQSFDLVNADYFVAGFLGYRHRDLSLLARLFHQSSHLGDEFLLRRSGVNRVNLSYEGIDAKLSQDLWDAVRIYAGGGYLVHRDPTSLDPWSVQYGLEVRSPWAWPGEHVRPVAGVDIQHREENDWSADVSIRAGLQFEGALLGRHLGGRNLQLLVEYFSGRSPNGQFYTRPIDTIGLGLHFHF
jgi:uncharacterized protein DUF1207